MSIRACLTLAALALAGGAALCLVPPAEAGWGASCGPVGPAFYPMSFPAAAPAADAPYLWQSFADGDADLLRLTRGGADVGVYRFSTGVYRPRTGLGFGDACAPPVAVPGVGVASGPLPGDLLPTGVVQEKITGGDRYTRNGRVVPARDFFEAMLAGDDKTVPDDAAKDSLTVVADDAARPAILAALPPALAARCVVQAFAPGDWHVAGYRWPAPCVARQRPDGKMVWLAADADPEKVRKIDPDFDPSLVPDPTKLVVKPNVVLPPFPAVPGWVWGAVAGGCGLLCFGGFALLFLVVILVLLFRGK